MKLLIGGDSEIGAATYRYLKAQGAAVRATTRRRAQLSDDSSFLDLAMEIGDWEPPPGTRSACILIAIARLTACAADPAGSAHINVTRTLTLIDRLIAHNIHVLFLSTNQVFDGLTPHVRAEAPICPVSEYGRQKARVEAALRRHMDQGAAVTILRLGKVIAPAVPLIGGWVDALAAGKSIQAFHDMPVAPTPIDRVSTAIGALMTDQAGGVYQLTGPCDATYAEIGRFLASRLGADPNLVTELSARAAGLPEGATPRHTTLDSSALRERYDLQVPDIWSIIEQMFAARTVTR